jgi:hypothetical protein
VGHPRYTTNEIVQRGQAFYDQHLRQKLEPVHNGMFLVLNIETGDYEIDADEVAASDRAAARNPDAAFYILRIGYPVAHQLGNWFDESRR